MGRKEGVGGYWVGRKIIESIDDLSVSRNKIIINPTQKVSQEY